MTATVICGALAVTMIAPLLHRESQEAKSDRRTSVKTRPVVETKTETKERFAEFYPTLAEARQKLKHFESVAGPIPPTVRERRVAHDSKSAGHLTSQQRPVTTVAADISPARRSTPPAPVTPMPVPRREPATPQPPRHFYRSTNTASAVSVARDEKTYSPAQIPSGIVYAPVTVNVDNSSFADQLREISTRFDKLEISKQQFAKVEEELTKKKTSARKRQRHRQPAEPVRNIQEEKIVRIEASVQKLTDSMEALHAQTQSEIDRLARQTDRAAVASELMHSYERMMDQKIERLATAAAQAIPLTRIAQAPSDTRSDAVPFPVVPEQQEIRNFGTAEELNAVPEVFEEPPTIVFPPALIDIPANQKQTLSPTQAPPATVIETSDVLQYEEPKALEFPSASNVQTPDGKLWEPQSSPSTVELSIPRLLDLTTDAPEIIHVPEPMRQDEPERSPRVSRPVAKLVPVPSPRLQDVMPPSTPTAVVQPVPALPVGYEHVYRFKLAEVESGAVVVPGDGPVCPHCGRIHTPGELATHSCGHSKSTATALVQTSASTTPRPAPRPPKVVAPPEQKKRVINRTGGRGSNRHVQLANQNANDRPTWDVEIPSFQQRKPASTTARKSGFLQRVSSTLHRFVE